VRRAPATAVPRSLHQDRADAQAIWDYHLNTGQNIELLVGDLQHIIDYPLSASPSPRMCPRTSWPPTSG